METTLRVQMRYKINHSVIIETSDTLNYLNLDIITKVKNNLV